MSLKSELICNICQMILSDPVTLPCSSMICGEHLQDGANKHVRIRCLKCDTEFDVPESGFLANEIVANILAKEFHLDEEEKSIRHAIQLLIPQMEQLQADLKLKSLDLERSCPDYFSKTRRNIGSQRGILSSNLTLQITNQVDEKEKTYNLIMKESILVANAVDIEQIRQMFENEIRRPDLKTEEAKRMLDEIKQKLEELQASLAKLGSLNDVKIKPSAFTESQIIQEDSLNHLKLFTPLVAYCCGNIIKIMNLATKKCLTTLKGHTNNITFLEKIDENRFASGSDDKTIRIWDSKNFLCLKTLAGHLNAVSSLKTLTSNIIASGSNGDIKIWNIESGDCIQKLNGHSDWISGFVYLPNGNLVSCSDRSTIKVWDLARGECIQTLAGHSGGVCCIVLLRNGQLASGSQDRTIKIWNLGSGECIKTLQKHSGCVWLLEQLESGELVSCSSDKTINIWNLAEGNCIRTLVNNNYLISSTRVNSQNNTLVSFSYDGIIKTWNLKTGECVNTIVVENEIQLEDLFQTDTEALLAAFIFS